MFGAEETEHEVLLRRTWLQGDYENYGYAVLNCQECDEKARIALTGETAEDDLHIMQWARAQGWLMEGYLGRCFCPTCASIVKARYAQPEQEPQAEETPNQPIIQNSIF